MSHSPLHGLGRIQRHAPRVARHVLAQGNLAKSIALFGVAMLVLTNAARAADLPVLTSGHTDVGVNFADGAWDLHVHHHDSGEFEPDAVWLQVGSEALSQVPTNAAFSFLGEAGALLWVLPAVENHDLLFLGLGTEELASGIFSNDTVTLALKSVTGPGDFVLYALDMFGNPVVSMNSRDGIGAADARALTAGGHVHVNWVFSAPGQYRIGLQASGVLAATGETNTSDIAEYLFDVQPLHVDAGHVGVSVAYNTNTATWTLASGNAALAIKFAPDQVRWIAKGTAIQRIPGDVRFAFLGAAGDPIWVLPEVQDPNLLWPGFGLQAVPSGIFSGNDVAIRLVGLEGPGHFFLYQSDMLGNPVVSLNTRDGLDTNDVVRLKAGSHVHVSWGFTEPGAYRVSLQAATELIGGGESSSAVYDYLFEVQYAPLLSVTRKDAATLTLEWLSRERHEYHLQSTSDLASGTWAAHPGVDPVAGTGQFLTLDVPVEAGLRFFQLEIHEEGHHHHP